MEHHSSWGLFLRPMRSMEFGGRSPIKDGEIVLEPPQLRWPGTVSSELIRIHWELILRIERRKGGPFFGFNHCVDIH